jgi:AcrR family transcriptional regulator
VATSDAAERDRRAEKRDQILAAASRVFASRSFHLVRMDAVAGTARVGKGTLYRYFPSKEHLYLAVVAEAFDLLIRRLDQEEAAGWPPATALPRMIHAIVDTFARHLPYFRLMQQGHVRLLFRKKEVIRARRERIASVLGRVLDRGAEVGVFRKLDPVLAPSMLLGSVWGTVVNHAGDIPSELLTQKVVDLCLHGIVQSQGESRA